MIFRTASQLIWDLAMMGMGGFALWRGGKPEKLLAIGLILGSLATAVVENRQDWLYPQWGILLVDFGYLALAVWIGMRSDRVWPLFTAGFQLVAVITHGAMMADRGVGGWAYITAGVIWSYMILLSIVVGTWLQWLRPRRLVPSHFQT